MDDREWLARSAGSAAPRAAFSHQPAAGSAQNFHDASVDERVSELPLSLWRKTRLRSDRHVRESTRGKDVRALRIQSFESRRDYEVQSILSSVGIPQHRYQKSGNGRTALGLHARTR